METMNEESTNQRGSVWWQRIVSALLGIAVTVVGALILQKIQSREPRLVYSSVETVPFNGQNGVIGIYQVVVRNDGKREVEDISSYIRIAGAKIEQYHTIVAPSLTTTTAQVDDAVKVNIPSLNPGETAQISILASSPTFLPTHPDISMRAKGVNGEEATSGTPSKRQETSPLLPLLTAVAALSSTSSIYAVLRRRQRFGQAQVLESICRLHSLHSRAARYSTAKKVTYYNEADLLGDEAVQSSDAQVVSSVKKILMSVCVVPTMRDTSRAIVFFNLARIAAKEGNRDEVANFLAQAKSLSLEEIEARTRIDPLLQIGT
jgi:hypothetical protein